MIAKITIERFFSFGESQTIELNPGANILVGINASGKSNFIRAIRFLQDGISGKVGLEELINKTWGGIDNVVNSLDEKVSTFKIIYEIDTKKFHTWNSIGNISYQIEIKKEKNGFEVKEVISNNKTYILTSDDEINIYTHPFMNNNFIKILKTKKDDLVINQVSALIDSYESPLLELAGQLGSITAYDNFDSTTSSKIRQLSYFYTEKELLPNGENLTHLLSYINANHPKNYDLIIEKLKRVNPNFKDLAFVQPMASRSLLLLKEKNLSRAISIEHISDGTLRFLLLLAIFYNPNRGKVICLDEPELGLHPDMIRMVAEGIKYAANDGTQLFIATHSPLLLNEFDLENLLIFEKDDKNQTIAMRKSEEDFPDWEGEFYVGQMWLRGQIGGVRW